MSRLPFLLVLVPWLASARPWQGITPGSSGCLDVIEKFGEPTRRLDGKDGLKVMLYTGPQAIKDTTQAQFKCDPVTTVVQRIDVYPGPVIDAAAIESSYGEACEAVKHEEPCYWPKQTPQGKPYFLYAKLGLAVFFKEDGKTVHSFSFMRPQG